MSGNSEQLIETSADEEITTPEPETQSQPEPQEQAPAATKTLKQICIEIIKERKPQTLQAARDSWRDIVKEAEYRGGRSCDRTNVYRAARQLDEDHFFDNAGTPPESGTFTARIGEVKIEKLQRSQPEETADEEVVTLDTPAPQQQPQPTQQPQAAAPQPYVFQEPDTRDVKAASDLLQYACGKIADATKKPEFVMDAKEGERVGRAVLILTAGADGRIDPRYIAVITVATALGSRVTLFLPEIKQALKKKPKEIA